MFRKENVNVGLYLKIIWPSCLLLTQTIASVNAAFGQNEQLRQVINQSSQVTNQSSLKLARAWGKARESLIAEESDKGSVVTTTAQSQSADSGDVSPEPLATAHDELGLKIDDVNDLGYTLQRIRQQAVNIYVEAVRKQDSPEVKADTPTLTRVPYELPKDMHNLLPFRRAWLVYFVATLEPLIHLLKQDIKNVESGSQKLDVLPETRRAIDPLIKEWSRGVSKLDSLLTAATELIEDADKNNVELAKIASSLDSEVAELEHVRDKCFQIVNQMEKKPLKRSAEK